MRRTSSSVASRPGAAARNSRMIAVPSIALELYLEELGARGGRPPAFDGAWLAYRRQMSHGLIFWTYTHMVGQVAELQPEDHVPSATRCG